MKIAILIVAVIMLITILGCAGITPPVSANVSDAPDAVIGEAPGADANAMVPNALQGVMITVGLGGPDRHLYITNNHGYSTDLTALAYQLNQLRELMVFRELRAAQNVYEMEGWSEGAPDD